MSRAAYRPRHFGQVRAPKPVVLCECGAYACYGAGPPLQPEQEWWCPACVPPAFFAWPTSRTSGAHG